MDRIHPRLQERIDHVLSRRVKTADSEYERAQETLFSAYDLIDQVQFLLPPDVARHLTDTLDRLLGTVVRLRCRRGTNQEAQELVSDMQRFANQLLMIQTALASA